MWSERFGNMIGVLSIWSKTLLSFPYKFEILSSKMSSKQCWDRSHLFWDYVRHFWAVIYIHKQYISNQESYWKLFFAFTYTSRWVLFFHWSFKKQFTFLLQQLKKGFTSFISISNFCLTPAWCLLKQPFEIRPVWT